MPAAKKYSGQTLVYCSGTPADTYGSDGLRSGAT
jgi:hypothetical protein